MSHELWKDRCKDRHKRTNRRPPLAAFLEVEQEVRSLYAMKDSILTTDHIAFTDDIEIHLGNSLHKLRAWVHRWKPVLIKSALQCHRIAIANTRPITEYFPIPGGKRRKLRVTRPYRTQPKKQKQMTLKKKPSQTCPEKWR